MIPFTLSALNAAHVSPLAFPTAAPLAPPPSATQETAAPLAVAPKKQPARDPTARLAAALAESEKAARKR